MSRKNPGAARAPARLVAIERKWKEQPSDRDVAGLRALEAAEAGRVTQQIMVCRTGAAYRLADGTWVLNVADSLKRLASRR